MRQMIYIAAPLFNIAERQFNLDLARTLESEFAVFLPQRDGKLLVELISGGMNIAEATSQVFETDIVAIRQCAALVAVLDGRAIDEGVSFELGVAYSLGKRCFGLQTDVRRLLKFGNNPMIDRALTDSFSSADQILEALRRIPF